MTAFSENLIKIRKQKRLSQEKLAEISGISQGAISMIEAGKRSPTETVMKMLADGLGVSLSEILDNEKIPPPQRDDGSKESLYALIDLLDSADYQRVADFAKGLLSSRPK